MRLPPESISRRYRENLCIILHFSFFERQWNETWRTLIFLCPWRCCYMIFPFMQSVRCIARACCSTKRYDQANSSARIVSKGGTTTHRKGKSSCNRVFCVCRWHQLNKRGGHGLSRGHVRSSEVVIFYIYVVFTFYFSYKSDSFRIESRLTLSDDLFEDGDDYVTLPPAFFDHLWQPDPYFLNSKVAGERHDLVMQALGFAAL